MKLKVCGMREPNNIQELAKLAPDYMGMIFYEKSKRYVAENQLPAGIAMSLVGVFVNATNEMIEEKVTAFGLDYLQLHGSEPVEQVAELKQKGYRLIKVFGVQDNLPLVEMKTYEPFVDFFLFDTKTPEHGGSGRKFDWSILEGYNLDTPYFLSGGIDLEDIQTIKKMNLSKLYAIDVNSRFEVTPGLKDIEKIRLLKQEI